MPRGCSGCLEPRILVLNARCRSSWLLTDHANVKYDFGTRPRSVAQRMSRNAILRCDWQIIPGSALEHPRAWGDGSRSLGVAGSLLPRVQPRLLYPCVAKPHTDRLQPFTLHPPQSQCSQKSVGECCRDYSPPCRFPRP